MAYLSLLVLLLSSSPVFSRFRPANPAESRELAEIKGKIQAQIEKDSQPWPHVSGSFRFCGEDSTDTSCCLRDFSADLTKLEGMDNILTPKRLNTYSCSGDCPRSNPFLGRWTATGEKSCQPVSWEATEVFIDDEDSGFKNIRVPELIVRACACV